MDKSAVQNANEVAITRVDLFFRAKPPPDNNKSGISKPGVEIKVVPCLNGVPVINQMGAYRPTEPTEHGAKFAFYSGGQTARTEYDQIQASTNGAAPTQFLFDEPIFVHTDKEYAIIVKFDGSENFVLWTSVQGDKLVGTDKVSPGPSGKFIGTLYHFIDDPNKQPKAINNSNYAYSNTVIDPAQANNSSLLYTAGVTTFEGLDTNYLQANWSPLTSEDLKFKVYVARYFVNGQYVGTLDDYVNNAQYTSTLDRPTMIAPADAASGNGIMTLSAPCQTSEYILYDLKDSVKDDLLYGEPFFQDGPSWSGGRSTPLTITCGPTVAGANVEYTQHLVQANGSFVLANGATFAAVGGFSSIFGLSDYLLIRDGANCHLRQIYAINSNTEIVVNEPFTTTITGASFLITPIGYLYDVSRSFIGGKAQDFIVLYNSTANATVRFTSFSLANATIAANGTSYSNNDYIKIDGFENINTNFAVQGNYSAFANIVTNANGSITSVRFSNTGSGFTNSAFLIGANVHIYQSAAGVPGVTPSVGTGANVVFTVGSNIKSAFKTTSFANCNMINIEVMRMKPEITVNNPLGSSFTIRHRTLYHSIPNANTFSGKAYYVDTPVEQQHTDTVSKIFKSHTLNTPATDKTPILTSRSNEFIIRYANGALSNTDIIGDPFANTAVFLFDISSNSDYQVVYFDPEIVTSHYAKYIINNDYTGEHTNYGAAWAKHIATKLNMATDRFSEDALIYLTAYRPAHSDLKVYARFHNSKDSDAFDDKEWTLLECIDGDNVYSSLNDSSNYIELTYNLPAFPNTDFTCNGTVSISQGNAFVSGNGTIFGPRITIVDGGTAFALGDHVHFIPPGDQYGNSSIFANKVTANAVANVTSIDGDGTILTMTLLDVGVGWDNQSNISTFTAFNANGAPSAGILATLRFNPGLQAGDLIKIYSPYIDFANTNYTTAVVNSVISNTSLTIKRTFGTLSANLGGSVSIATTSNTLTGTSTLFPLNFTNGDYIAIWSNSSVYETHKITGIASNTSLTMDTNGTFTNTAAKYSYVQADTFMNTSLNVTGLLVDRIAYPHQAFNHAQNDNVSRYYNWSMVEFDGYDTIQVKVVFLGDNDIAVPKVDDIRGVLVTA